MRHSEYYERGVDGEASESWMGERTLSSLYTGSDCFVGPLHHERAFQVYFHLDSWKIFATLAIALLFHSRLRMKNIDQRGDQKID